MMQPLTSGLNLESILVGSQESYTDHSKQMLSVSFWRCLIQVKE